jgi:hypothetical protein
MPNRLKIDSKIFRPPFKIIPYQADNCYKFMRIGLRLLELAFGVIKAKGWKEISTPFFMCGAFASTPIGFCTYGNLLQFKD